MPVVNDSVICGSSSKVGRTAPIGGTIDVAPRLFGLMAGVYPILSGSTTSLGGRVYWEDMYGSSWLYY